MLRDLGGALSQLTGVNVPLSTLSRHCTGASKGGQHNKGRRPTNRNIPNVRNTQIKTECKISMHGAPEKGNSPEPNEIQGRLDSCSG